MEIIEAIILGLIQGVTEFLPVSSSGHLIIAREILGFSFNGALKFDIFLHLATALAVIVYFRKDLLDIYKTRNYKKIFFIVIATLPAVVVGLIFKDSIENIFRGVVPVAYALVVGSIIFVIAEKISKKISISPINWWRSIIVGCFQALALVPGLSRSGMTISGGLIFGFTREEAVRFSFILGIPIILGTGFVDMLQSNGSILSYVSFPMLAGAISSFIFGILSIHFLVRFLSKHTLSAFAWYRVILALLLILFFI